MGFVLFFLIIAIMLVAVALVLIDSEPWGAIVSSLLALAVVLGLVFSVAPRESGYGRVPDRTEEFTKRLETGKVYELIAAEAVNDNGEKVFLVRDVGESSSYRAIRVKVSVPIPKYFKLINGQPVAIK